MLRIAHLHEDQTAGDLARYLSFLAADPVLAEAAEHRPVRVSRFAAGAAAVNARVIVSHVPLSLQSLPGLMALRARYPHAALVHVEHVHCEGSTAATRNRARLRAMLRSGYALFNHVVALSPAQARWMRRHELASPAQLSVIPPCATTDASATLPAPSGPVRRIGALGRLHRQSGFDMLIEAFTVVSDPDARLDIFGDGPQRAELRALARNDLRIRVHGNTTRLAALRQSDAVAIPSRWQPSALAAHEALAAGRRVLHTGRDALSHVSGTGQVTVADLSVAAWSRALSDVLAETSAAPRQPMEPVRGATIEGWQTLLDRLASRKTSGSNALATI
ncbi:glycosyltransferase [Alloyangia pacifica]|uniref:Glycosyltransferase involved in cell wall bisynthesis n=1 Tax=Alloyangia pacifica TaxID=311180 RepID=A0A1I6TLW3_9RHOB|nr:glycosyltransferase [Alloyangia pacifica]SDH14073.1 Glycosyltransferase involved in cell wall bisynthesis [Alloyangia pacifica]SFS90131.1 Glycosyltransferase involved in cell wall bisynthesis [Alloyangia pacifica]